MIIQPIKHNGVSVYPTIKAILLIVFPHAIWIVSSTQNTILRIVSYQYSMTI